MTNVLDFETLLREITGPNPAGGDLRVNPGSVYHTAKSAEYQARKAERKIWDGEVWDGEAPELPNWDPILYGVPEALATKAKDIELAAWLTEALLRKHQFAGLRDGLKLMRLLIQDYWDRGLHPDPKDHALSDCLRMLAAFNGEGGHDGILIRPIQQVPLTQGTQGFRPFGCRDYLEAQRVDSMQDPKQRQREIEKGAPYGDLIAKAEQQTSPEFIQQTQEMIGQCLAELAGLDATLLKKCSGCSRFAEEETEELDLLASKLEERADKLAEFVFSRCSQTTQQALAQKAGPARDVEVVRRGLADDLNALVEPDSIYNEPRFAGLELPAEAQDLIRAKPQGYAIVRLNRMLLESAFGLKRPSPAPSTALIRQALETCRDLLAHKNPAVRPADPSVVGGKAPGKPDSRPVNQNLKREEAFQQLLDVARFFELTEPHSPISYSLKNIVRWGELPLPELWGELIGDNDTRKAVFKLVGIPPKKEEPSK